MIVISGELLKEIVERKTSQDVFFLCRDREVYNLLNDNSKQGLPGTLHWAEGQAEISATEVGKADDYVRVIIRRPDGASGPIPDEAAVEVKGYVRSEEQWVEVTVTIIPVKAQLFSRIGGLLETDVIASKKVLIIGLGSVGSIIAMELAKCGVMEFVLIDHDRLEIVNVARHVAGVSHVGRYKTKAMAELIKDKNPYARIRTWERRVSWTDSEEVRTILREVDIVVCATDNQESKLFINWLCVKEGKPCIFPGAFRRAYGTQIIFRRTPKDPCYQCFVMNLPDRARDQEISNPEQATGIAYSDRPVAIEPGLSTDIAPVSIMTVKLIIQEFVKGTETTLRSLDEDLVAPWYLWLNRREPGTQYQKLGPLEFNVDGIRVLRWYGIDMKPDPACPVCGNFEIANQESSPIPDFRKLIGQPGERSD